MSISSKFTDTKANRNTTYNRNILIAQEKYDKINEFLKSVIETTNSECDLNVNDQLIIKSEPITIEDISHELKYDSEILKKFLNNSKYWPKGLLISIISYIDKEEFLFSKSTKELRDYFKSSCSRKVSTTTTTTTTTSTSLPLPLVKVKNIQKRNTSLLSDSIIDIEDELYEKDCYIDHSINEEDLCKLPEKDNTLLISQLTLTNNTFNSKMEFNSLLVAMKLFTKNLDYDYFLTNDVTDDHIIYLNTIHVLLSNCLSKNSKDTRSTSEDSKVTTNKYRKL
jgi:hypothetical protein